MVVRVTLLVLVAALSVAGLIMRPWAAQPAEAAPQIRIEIFGSRDDLFFKVIYQEWPGSNVSYIIRFNGGDWNWDAVHGGLNCCPAGSGEVTRRIVHRDFDDDNPAGGYEGFLFEGDRELARTSFYIPGSAGSEGSDAADNEN